MTIIGASLARRFGWPIILRRPRMDAVVDILKLTKRRSAVELSGKHIVLGLSGGIACYKSAELCRLLVKAGATVQVIMTDAATQFIGPVTLQALSNQPVLLSQWDARANNNMPHINASRGADAVLVAPASADLIAKLAQGQADDLLTLTCLARHRDQVPLLLAPAMNEQMWSHPATARNLQQVQNDGARVLGVGKGEQACGESGDGRMLEPEQILDDLIAHLTPQTLAGQRWLLTAGPTFEAIDPVRGITNLSSGKMGYAIAKAAQRAGATVTVVSGPVALPTPRGVHRIDVVSAQEMAEATMATLATAPAYDVFVGAAAVADWRVTQPSGEKIKKEGAQAMPSLTFVENPDILAAVARMPIAQVRGPGEKFLFCVGFAAESHDLERHASEKRLRKGVPLMVGNIGPATFGKDENALLLLDEEGTIEIPSASKDELAQRLIFEINKRLTR
jgi:phosphopantothenoylcysteine decarboxylase/phosphopantothenate--cysteine ligase